MAIELIALKHQKGVLYARYSQHAAALREFQAALARLEEWGEGDPALRADPRVAEIAADLEK